MREMIRSMSQNEVMSAGRWTIRRENGNEWIVWDANGVTRKCESSIEVAELVAR